MAVFGPWGNEATASARFSGAWITDPRDPAGTVIRLRYGGVGRQNSRDRAKTAMQFVGRKYPVYDIGDARAESISVDAVLSSEDGDAQESMDRLERMIGEGEVVLFRDGRGRKMYSMGTDFQAEDLELGSYRVTFLLNRVDYDEALPEPDDTPPVPVDTQPKNFTVALDAQNRMAMLEWNDVAGAQLYRLFLNGVEVGSTSESATIYGPLEPGDYVFYVVAVVGGVDSPPSLSRGITVPQPPGGGDPGDPPDPPTTVPQNFRAFPKADNSVDLAWDPVPGATEYQVFEIRSPNGVTNGITTLTTQTRGKPTPLGDGPFDYWVKAKVNGVWSGESNHQQFTLPYDGGPIGGGDPEDPGSGELPDPVDVLGIRNGDAGYLHYNLGMGFRSGHEDIFVQDLENWSTTTANKLRNYYYTIRDAAGNLAVYMTVDPDGGTTSDRTEYPRNEHREMEQTDSGNANKAAWNVEEGEHDFSGYSRIMSLPPAKPGVCINQLHDPDDDTVMIKTLSLNGKIATVLDVRGSRVHVFNSDYKLGREIWSRIRITDGGNLEVYYSESSSATTEATPSTEPAYEDEGVFASGGSGWYHKWGCYAQSNDSTDSSGTKCVVQVRGWKQWHTGWPAPVDPTDPGGGGSTPPVVSAGADATVTPGATFTRTAIVQGAGITSQGWRLLGTGGGGYEPNTAAGALNWGAELPSSDDFRTYTGSPNPAKWSLPGPDWAGHNEHGTRDPERSVVTGGRLVMSGLANGSTGWMRHKLEQTGGGKWEVRMKSKQNAASNGNNYHVLLLIWPQSDDRPLDGEYDFFENSTPGEVGVTAFMHFPHPWTEEVQQRQFTKAGVDTSAYHNYAFEYKRGADGYLKGYIDGVLWFNTSGGAVSGLRRDIQDMPAGHLNIQLDNFDGTNQTPAQMEVEWVKIYPTSPLPTSNPTLSNTPQLNWTAPTTPGTYTLEYFATNPEGTATDQVTVTVAATPPGGGGPGDPPPAGDLVYPETFDDGTPYSVFGTGQNVVNVSGSSALRTALQNAQPGQIITLASGSYSGEYTISGKRGTASSGIVIRSATRLGAQFAAGSNFIVKDCEHVTIEGLDFPFDDEGDVLQFRGASKNVQFYRCRVGASSFSNKSTVGNYVYVGDDVKHFRIGYCTFRNKGTSGNVIRVYGNFDSYVGCQYGRIDHNLIDTVGDEVGNDKECIRYGVSTMSRTVAHAVIERNVIVNAKAEPEVISGKMANVVQRGNTILRCAGGIVIRHGRNCKQQSNYVIDRASTQATAGLMSGGSRFYDSGHIIEDNYFDGLFSDANFQRPLMLDSGDAAPSSSSLSNHFNVIDCDVRRNVIVNCKGGIFIGDNYSTAPSNCSVTDNDVINSGGTAVTKVGGMSMTGDSTETNNVHYANGGAGGYTQGADTIWRKSGRGPKVSYLTPSMVGVDGDLDNADRTGAAV